MPSLGQSATSGDKAVAQHRAGSLPKFGLIIAGLITIAAIAIAVTTFTDDSSSTQYQGFIKEIEQTK